MSNSPAPKPPAGSRESHVVVSSYQQLKEVTTASSSHRSTPQTSDPPAWAMPVVRQVLSPAAHLLPHRTSGEGPSPDRTENSRISMLERELESRRAAMSRMESENLSLLRDITNWKLSEEERAKRLHEQHREETEGLRDKLKLLASEFQKQQPESGSASSSSQDRHALILLQQKIDMRDAEVASLTQKLIVLEQQRILQQNAPSHKNTEGLLGRIEGLEQLQKQKDEELNAADNTIHDLRRQLQEKSVDISRIKRDIAGKESIIADLREELESLKRTSDGARRQIDELHIRVRVLTEEVTLKETQSLEHQLGSRGDLDKLMEGSKAQAKELEQTKQLLLKADAASQKWRQEADAARAELAVLESAASTLKAQSQHHSVDTEELHTTIDDLRIALADAQTRLRVCLDEAEQSKSAAEAARGSLEVHRDENVRKIESLTIALRTVEEHAEALKATNARVQRELQLERDHSLGLQQRLDDGATKIAEQRSLLTEIDELAFDINKKQQLIAHHHEQHQDTIRKIASLERELERVQTVHAATLHEKDALEKQITEQSSEIQHWYERAEMCEVLEKRIIQSDADVRGKHEELQVLTVAYEELRHHCSSLQSQVDQIVHLEDAMRRLAHEKQDAFQQFEHAQVTLLSEREALARLSSSHEIVLKQLRSAEDERALHSAELSTARGLAAKLNEASRQLEQRDADIETVRVEVHRVEITNQTLQHEKLELGKQLQGSELAQAELRNEIRRLQVQLSDTQTNLGRIEVRDADYRKRNEKLLEQFEATENHKVELLLKVQDTEDALTKLRTQLEETNRRVAELQSRVAATQEEKNSIESQLHEARGLLQSTSVRFAAAEEQAALLEQRVSHQGSLEAKIKAQFTIIESKTKEVDTLQRDCNELRDKAATADASIAVRRTLEETLERSRRSFEQSDSERLRLASLNETLERRVSTLEGDVGGREREARRLQDTIAHERSRYDALMEELQVLQRKLKSKASLDGKYEAMQGICDQQREDLGKLRQQLADVHDRGTQEKLAQDQVRELTFEVRQLRVQLESKGAAVLELEEEVEKKVAHIARLRRDIQDKDAQYAQSQEQVQEAKRDAARATREWESLHEQHRTKSASSREASQRHQHDADAATTAHLTLEESLRTLEQRYSASQHKVGLLEDLASQLRAQLRDAETGKAKVEMDLDLLRASLHQSKESQDRAISESTSLRQECAQLIAAVREKDKSMVHLQAVHSRELQSRDDDITALAKMIDDIKHHAAHSVAKHHHNEEHQSTMSIERRLLEDTNEQLRDDIGALHAEIRHLRSMSRSPHSQRQGEASLDIQLRVELEQAELRLADEQRRHRALQQQHDDLLRSVDSVKRAFAQREATLEADLREAKNLKGLQEEERQIRRNRM